MKTRLGFLVVACLAAIAMADTNVTGKWSGTFNITRDAGERKDPTALLVLKQNGSEITGTVGPGDDEQFEIQTGKIEGDKITLQADHNGLTVKLSLVLAEDRITGDVSMSGGGENAKAKIDVKRVK